MLDPAWEGRLAVAPSNASFQDFIAAMILERGEEETAAFLEGLVALDPRIEANNVAIVDAVGRGEVDAGLVNHYYGVLALMEDPTLPIANHFFPQGDLGSFVLVAGVGILDAGEDHQEQAQAFVDYLLSTAGPGVLRQPDRRVSAGWRRCAARGAARHHERRHSRLRRGPSRRGDRGRRSIDRGEPACRPGDGDETRAALAALRDGSGWASASRPRSRSRSPTCWSAPARTGLRFGRR